MHGSSQIQKARYCFRVFANGLELHVSDALEFSHLEDAWHEGAMTACELIRAMFGRIEPDLDWRLEVSDEPEKLIYRFSFKAERL